ncbi:MAG: PASTA domain-containing protein, partial [Planctomycetota bacterium]
DGTRVLIGSTVDLIVSLGRPVVPHVCGWFEAEAVAAIRGVDNLDAAVTYAYDDTVPQGKVVSQHPAGETAVDIGTTVNIVVSLGRPEVPDVTGRTESEARPAITAVDNLKIGAVVYEYRDTITAGLVISQNPAGHTMVPVGSSVDLVVSLGRPEVPDVVGRTESEARLAITAVDNLTVNTVTYRYCDTVPTGVVTAQSPVGHTKVPIGSSVELVVSLGQPEVPNVVTMSEADARLAITAVDNLQIGNVTYEYSDSVGVGLVISQSPAGYTRVPIGSSVELVVSLGQPEVPNVLGMNVSGASSAITAAGLTVGTLTYEYSDTVPSGLIIGQDPPGETAAPVGTEVDLVVSLGRPAAPYVIGMTLTAATTKIESVDNLTVGAVTDQYSSTVAAGLVMNQDPSQGTRVQIGSTVDLVISLGRPMVPYVVGMTEAAARTAIEAVETLTVGTISREYSNTAEVGRVISQNPAGGTAAPVGSTVDLVISLGQPVVPNIVGQTEGRAAAAIHAIDNLATDLTYEYRDSTPEGIVMSQDPVGGTTVVIGTTVSLVVSLGQPPSVVLGGYRLVELQNSDGGWDWPSDDGDPTRGSDPYTFASVAMGLAQSYRHSRQTSEPNMLAALQNAKTFLLSKTHNFVSSDGAIAVELDGVLGGTESTNYVRSNFFDRLAAGTYADARSVLFDCNTAEYVQAQRERYGSGFANLGAWEMGLGLYGAHAIGASTSEWIAGLEAEIDELDGSQVHDVLGLAGAVFGLAAAGEDYDPQSGEHAAASGLRDLAEILAGYQLDTGGFPWWGMSSGEGSEAVEETAYGLMALSQFDRVGYSAEIRDGRTYLQSVRLQTGGWENYPGWGEDNEIT